MGFLSTLLGIIGFGIGAPIGLLVGFFVFVYSEPGDIKDPDTRPLSEMDTHSLHEILPEIPFWVKNPDYERVDWLNKFFQDMWSYLNKGICSMIRNTVEPLFSAYKGKYLMQSIEFEKLDLGTLPPIVHGIKIYETNEKELIMEPAIKWAGNPNVTVVIKLLNRRITIQVIDLQIFTSPRITLKPLLPTFPCFANIAISLMEKPHVDFGLKILGGDIMSIPGIYRFVQETIKKQVARLYLWPQVFEVAILDTSTGAVKKPVGILHVNVVRAVKLLKMDLLGTSDPYVKLRLSGDRLPSKKTTVKRRNLNPEWNEKFKLIVKDPSTQVLELHVFDWDKVGGHDRLGMQILPLKWVTEPHETRMFTLDLLKNSDVNDPQNKKRRGQIVVELTFVPFVEDGLRFSGPLDMYERKDSLAQSMCSTVSLDGAGLLIVTVQGAEGIEGVRHCNPYALVLFRGDQRKTKVMRKMRDPRWDEEFQFMVEEAPLNEKIRIQVKSRPSGFGFRSKESLGHVDINLNDVVYNGRINEKYNLIDSKRGVILVEIRWKTI